MLTGAIVGGVVAVIMLLMNISKAKSGTGLPGEIEKALRSSGRPMTLAEIATAVKRDSFMGRGQVVQALNGLGVAKKVKTNPAPEGTPQLEKVKHITYELILS